ncbi:MAG TPA: hypothetical protein VMY39_02800 [Planctomycetota bacterium]|nr:hypothetical protein [Planctomycetota bacterium]
MKFKVGDLVRVGRAYVGNGRHASDGAEGLYTVVGLMAPESALTLVTAPGNYYLARGDWRDNPTKSEWNTIIHETRIKKARLSAKEKEALAS